jgi:tetratricopeptide (TPR) repeat protein
VGALKINPKYAIAWANKGLALGKCKKHDKALEAFEKALKLNPKLALTWANKGAAITRLNEDKKALKEYEKALEAFEKALKINSKQAEAWYNMACTYSLMDKTEEAIVNLKYAIKLDPSLKKEAKGDPDFKELQKNTKFQKIVAANETHIPIFDTFV